MSATEALGSPAPRDPFPQIPAFEGRCIPAGFGARPLQERTPGGRPHSALLLRPAPPRIHLVALVSVTGGPGAMRGVPQSGVWSEKGVSPPRGVRSSERNRSERAQGRERSECGSPPRARGLRYAAQPSRGTFTGMRERSIPAHGAHRYPSRIVAARRSSAIRRAPTRLSRNSSWSATL